MQEMQDSQQQARTPAPTGEGDYPQSDWYSLPISEHNAREKQRPPEGDWRIFLVLAGRGWGKTRTIVEWAIEQARTMPKSRGAFVGATASDVRDILVLGESGLLNIASDDFRPAYNPSKRLITWPNGSMALLFSADEPNRLRGLQHSWAIVDELAAWRYAQESWDQLLLGLRLGDDPRVAIATTPRPTPLIKRLLKDATCTTVRGSTYENKANLAPAFLTNIVNRYEGTTLGRQELDAEILDDMPGALWQRAELDAHRVTDLPELVRIVVGVDPAVTSAADSDETGIVVAGLGANGHGYILDDASVKASPDAWAKQVVSVYNKHGADRVIAEVNNGGDLVGTIVHGVDANVSYKSVRAAKGKHTRAEPISALYEQGRVHHVGTFATLEDQMCSWIVGDADSPDRLDALVWALSEMMLKHTPDIDPEDIIRA